MCPMGETGRDSTDWKQRLHGVNLRATPARLGVLRVLAGSPSPLSAQEVLEAMATPDTDRVTVYRTLNSLVDAGLAHKLDPGDRVWRFGLIARSHNGHAHFVCDECGDVTCLEDALIQLSFRKGGPSRGVRITQQDVVLHGKCDRCDDHASRGRGRARKSAGQAER